MRGTGSVSGKSYVAGSLEPNDTVSSSPQKQCGIEKEIGQIPIFEGIVGSSPALQAMLSRLAMVAPTDSTVLITGETGSGKELVARALHRLSNRPSRPFVPISCAAVPSSLIVSELFGYEKGAFTGAEQRRPGWFEVADGGTIFFDEIGELPLEAQGALLRVLQERKFERVGGRSHSISIDVRVIAATNRNLETAAAEGNFRLDLFYRLNVFPLEVPPLRNRKEDIPVLLKYFTDRYARRAGKSIKQIDKRTIERFQAHDWKGNVRELENLIERFVIICEGEILSIDESWLLNEVVQPAAPLRRGGKFSELQRELIESALTECRGRVSGPSGAAAKLGIPSSTLESKIKALKIRKGRFKD